MHTLFARSHASSAPHPPGTGALECVSRISSLVGEGDPQATQQGSHDVVQERKQGAERRDDHDVHDRNSSMNGSGLPEFMSRPS